jgi:hypothetical protein
MSYVAASIVFAEYDDDPPVPAPRMGRIYPHSNPVDASPGPRPAPKVPISRRGVVTP